MDSLYIYEVKLRDGQTLSIGYDTIENVTELLDLFVSQSKLGLVVVSVDESFIDRSGYKVEIITNTIIGLESIVTIKLTDTK